MKHLLKQLRVLSKPHSFEIVEKLTEGPTHTSTISENLGIPYTTTWQRVAEMERAGLVEVESGVDERTGRAIRIARIVNFRLELSPRIIKDVVKGEESELKVV